jgi:hypothetical protein
MSKITVNIEHGKVFRIDDIPTDVVIVVRNYDTKAVSPDKLSRDENGRKCEVYEHHPAE